MNEKHTSGVVGVESDEVVREDFVSPTGESSSASSG